MKQITVATDGACTGNPGPAGWAWVIDDTRWQAGSLGAGTNNIAELEAIRRVLTAAPDHTPLRILTDSEYALNAITKWARGWARAGWRTKSGQPVKNRARIEAITTTIANRAGTVNIEWVRGHNGHPLNEAADQLAVRMVKLAPDRRTITGPGWG